METAARTGVWSRPSPWSLPSDASSPPSAVLTHPASISAQSTPLIPEDSSSPLCSPLGSGGPTPLSSSRGDREGGVTSARAGDPGVGGDHLGQNAGSPLGWWEGNPAETGATQVPTRAHLPKRLAHQGRQRREGQRTPAVLASPHLWVTGAQVPPEHSPPFLVLWSGQAGAASTLRSGRRM